MSSLQPSYIRNDALSPRVASILPVSRYYDPHFFKYVIRGDNICRTRNSNDNIYIIAIVGSAPHEFAARQVLRNTWGSYHRTNRSMFRLAFLLGVGTDPHVQKKVIEENIYFQDIIQEDFQDTYLNLTVKSVAMLKWVSQYCNNAKYLVKSDTDTFLNVPNLILKLQEVNIGRVILGKIFWNSEVVRDKWSKYYVSKEIYPEERYPDYAAGAMYVISTDIVDHLYRASFRVPLFWLEDVYVNGLLARNVGSIVHIDDPKFSHTRRDPPTGCSFANVITGHQHKQHEIVNIWMDLNKPNLMCS